MGRNYCGFCGTLGHNRRTCPDRPQEYKDLDRKWNAKPGRKKGSAVECSYCGLTGHNRRTCWHLDHRRSIALENLEEALSEGLRGLCEHGLGPGALYAKSGTWTDKQATYIITNGLSVRFDDASYRCWPGATTPAGGIADRTPTPTFSLNIMGHKVYGDLSAERDLATTVDIHCSHRKPPVTRLSGLIAFVSEPGTMVGSSNTRFPEYVLDTLRRLAVFEVNEYFQRKDTKHPYKGNETRLETIQAEVGQPIGKNTTAKRKGIKQ